ncbi:DUF1840 domain-containing protein [Limnohabitans sp. Rim8]|uniref:DUF1840 domain-containing protein n=1 Tax=Limnohabitans sp. Rim8 TaxID=1100718 RepID=UPI0026061ED3|nr:DUF1840 domain-containing protein [Limnohabitans sp. Rim8]
MLFKFKSKVTSDLIMLEADGRRLLKIMLGDDPIKGIVLSQDMPAVLAKLESAVAQDEALRAQRSVDAQNGKYDAVADANQPGFEPDVVRLAQRASPMVKLLKQCVANPTDLVWGV